MDDGERMKVFLARLLMWKRRLEADNYTNIPILEEVLQQDRSESNNALSASLQAEFCRHIDTLQNSLKGHFG